MVIFTFCLLPPPKQIQSLPAQVPNTTAMIPRLTSPSTSVTPYLRKNSGFSQVNSSSFMMVIRIMQREMDLKREKKGGLPFTGQLNLHNRVLQYSQKESSWGRGRVFKRMWNSIMR